MKKKRGSGFTLIELLVVIAIIAILAVVVILTLNPGELLRQSRDSNRISDMATLKNALGEYTVDQSVIAGFTLGTTTVCYNSTNGSSTFYTPNASGTWATTSSCAAWFASGLSTASTSGRGINGTGWLPVDFASTTSGSPIATLPVDPLNTDGTGSTKSTGAFFYGYISGGTTYKLSAFMESIKFSTAGSNDVETNDGGINNYVYEQGSNLAL
jgi:prepilin-type N-terminal cleavage/methylation domain-containing protein